MCGISGAFQLNNNDSDIDYKILEKFINTLINSVKLRGPDNENKLKVSNGFLGHTRLAIRDLSSLSNQPVYLEKDQSSFVYNGEIYNNHEILKKNSISIENSDTLSLKKLFEYKRDVSFINDLIGDFAIGYWNNNLKKLFLIRDHFGKKPIYYVKFKDYFLFNSSINGLKDIITDKTIDDFSLLNYLSYGNMFDDKTIFKEIKQVLPGTILVWDAESGFISDFKYFNLREKFSRDNFLKFSYEDLTTQLSEKLEEVISSHLCSDVPISILLSSGIDSKAIARYSYSSKIKAYTADFQTNNKEIENANKFSKYFSEMEHELVKINDFKVFEILEKIINFLGEPFADASIIPLYYLYSSLPKSSKVVLQGDGGDELFGGYNRYLTFEILNKFPKIYNLENFTKRLVRNHRLQRIIYLTSLQDEELYKNIMTTDFKFLNTISFFKNYFINKNININNNLGYTYARDFKISTNSNQKAKLSEIDFINQLPNQFLYKVDRTSMICGVEARVPLVDMRIINFVSSIDPKIRFRANPQKRFFRDSVDIPRRFKNIPKKGFGTPISNWLVNSNSYLRESLLSEKFLDFFMLEKNEINNLLNVNKFSSSSSYCLWKILCLSIWFKNVFEK